MMRIRSIPYKWLVATVFVSGLFMDILDTTVVNVALPTLGRDFAAGADTLEWVVTGYLLSLAVWIPASGWIGDRFGTKKTFMFAIATFTTASALCGLSWNIESLIAFRILQGVGGGMLTPVGTAMLFRAFPVNERAKASAVLAVPTMLAPTLGPILGGWLVDAVSWLWIFFVNLPVGIAAFAFAAFALQEHTEEQPGRFDLPGFVLSGAGLALLLFALSKGPDSGWDSALVLSTGIAGFVSFALLVVVELRTAEPMLDLRLLRDRMFRSANLVIFVGVCGMLGVLFLLPLYLQQLRGFSALDSGLTTFPQSIGMLVLVPLASRLYPKVGPRRMIAIGFLGVAGATALLLRLGLNTDLWWLRGNLFLMGLTMSFFFVPMQAAAFATISSADTGRASSLMSTVRQLGSAVGVALLATVMVDRGKAHVADALRQATPGAREAAIRHGTLMAYHDAFFVAVIFAALGIAFALLIHDEDAAASMHRPGSGDVDDMEERVLQAVH
jgi:EmrB/QacA subfamily drug resistance transporter